MKNDAKELVCTFVADKLDDDITRLASFELGTLKTTRYMDALEETLIPMTPTL